MGRIRDWQSRKQRDKKSWSKKLLHCLRQDNNRIRSENNKKKSPSYCVAKGIISLLHLEPYIVRDKRAEKLERLFLTRKQDIILEHWYRKIENVIKIFSAFFLLGLLLVAYEIWGGSVLIKGNLFKRPDYGRVSKQYEFVAHSKNAGEKEMSLSVSAKAYTKKQWEEIAEKGIQYLKGHFLGQNESKEKIYQNLNLPAFLPDTPVHVEWDIDPYDSISRDGTVKNDDLDKAIPVKLTAVLTYGDWEKRWEVAVIVQPKILSFQEAFWKEVEAKMLEEDKQTASEAYISLPKQVNGETVTYHEKRSQEGIFVILAGIGAAALMFMKEDADVDRKDEKRKREINSVYPVLVNKFILLMGAGMTVKATWGKIVAEYQEKKSREGIKQYAYEEMTATWQDLCNGISEVKAYEAFGKRMGTTAYLKFSTLLSQNLRKGSRGLLALLELEAVNAWEDKKEQAKRKGEEAGTRLLMPMMLMFLLVMIIILVPAMEAF